MNPRLVSFVVPASLLAFACVQVAPTEPTPFEALEADAAADAAPDAVEADAGPVKLPFRPTNFDMDAISAPRIVDVKVTSRCEVDESSTSLCGEHDVASTVVRQPDGSDLRVLVARSIRVLPGASIKVKGTGAVAIVSLGDFEIHGNVDASASWDRASPGGFRSPQKSESPGGGPGGGGAGSSTNGAGGGSYCGQGGTGASMGGAVTEPGAIYGNPEISPLVGGSGGGVGTITAGTGGGAIQLVAGKKLVVGKGASIAAGGGYGNFWGAPDFQHGSGGGSGGAILLEASDVVVDGVLAANGAGGGAAGDGKDALPSTISALGGTSRSGSKGGSGSAGDDPRGGDAIWVGTGQAPGGGGGAGRIRLNSASGTAAIGGALSPSIASSCATLGKVKPL
ncbi:MAG: hypothetical protein JNL38_04795 [Myxococcales bacterium]|nr:hypothetical protein [Myxococcales bacterium]